MKKTTIIGHFLMAMTVSLFGGADEPHPFVILSNAHLRAKVYLPDPEKGFVRGPRYVPAGIVGRVTTAKNFYFNNFLEPHDPTAVGAAAGLIDEFRLPVGYTEAKIGELFGKIGVGLIKREPGDYAFGKHYPVEKFAPWVVISNVGAGSTNANSITFVQEFSHQDWGWSFEKTISLEAKSARLLIRHKLKNTGRTAFTNNHYNHNFISIDGELLGSNYLAAFNFYTLSPQVDSNDLWIEKNVWQIRSDFAGSRAALIPLQGFAYAKGVPSVTVYNQKTKGGLSVAASGRLSEYLVFLQQKAFCPEPFVSLYLEPGGEDTWEYRYDFYDGAMPVPPASSLDDRAYHGVKALFLDGKPLTTFQFNKMQYRIPTTNPAHRPKLSALSFNSKDHIVVEGNKVTLKPYDARVSNISYTIDLHATGGITATGSTEKAGYEAMNTLDNDPETRWTASGSNHWIQFDLGQIRELKGMGLIWGSGDARRARYGLEISEDAKNWENIFQGESSGTIRGWETNTFRQSVKARYVRYIGNGNSQNAWNNIAEVSFLGE